MNVQIKEKNVVDLKMEKNLQHHRHASLQKVIDDAISQRQEIEMKAKIEMTEKAIKEREDIENQRVRCIQERRQRYSIEHTNDEFEMVEDDDKNTSDLSIYYKKVYGLIDSNNDIRIGTNMVIVNPFDHIPINSKNKTSIIKSDTHYMKKLISQLKDKS